MWPDGCTIWMFWLVFPVPAIFSSSHSQGCSLELSAAYFQSASSIFSHNKSTQPLIFGPSDRPGSNQTTGAWP
jgi:hypothetical protein